MLLFPAAACRDDVVRTGATAAGTDPPAADACPAASPVRTASGGGAQHAGAATALGSAEVRNLLCRLAGQNGCAGHRRAFSARLAPRPSQAATMQQFAATNTASFAAPARARAARPAKVARGLSVRAAANSTPFDSVKFAPIRESEVSRAMSKRCGRLTAC